MPSATCTLRSWLAVLTLTLLLAPPAFAQPEPHPIAVQIKAQLKDPTRPFTMLVSLQIKEGTQEKFETAFANAIRETRKEKGCIAYDLNRDTRDPTRYIVYERWKNLTDLEAHLRTAHITALLGELKDILAGMPDARAMLPASE